TPLSEPLPKRTRRTPPSASSDSQGITCQAGPDCCHRLLMMDVPRNEAMGIQRLSTPRRSSFPSSAWERKGWKLCFLFGDGREAELRTLAFPSRAWERGNGHFG